MSSTFSAQACRSCDDNVSVCRHLVDTGAVASIFTIASQPAAPTVRALGACIVASAAGPSPDSLAILLVVLQAAFAVNVVDSSLELCSRLAAQVHPRARIVCQFDADGVNPSERAAARA